MSLNHSDQKLRTLRQKYRAERESLVLWVAPVQTTQHFILELFHLLHGLLSWLCLSAIHCLTLRMYARKGRLLSLLALVAITVLFVELEEDQLEVILFPF